MSKKADEVGLVILTKFRKGIKNLSVGQMKDKKLPKKLSATTQKFIDY